MHLHHEVLVASRHAVKIHHLVMPCLVNSVRGRRVQESLRLTVESIIRPNHDNGCCSSMAKPHRLAAAAAPPGEVPCSSHAQCVASLLQFLV